MAFCYYRESMANGSPEALCYDIFYDAFVSGASSFVLPMDVAYSPNGLWPAIWKLVLSDHPELFDVHPEVAFEIATYPNGLKEVSAKLSYNMSKAQALSFEPRYRAIRDAFARSLPSSATPYEKVQAAYEYIVKHCEYDVNAPHEQDITSVFDNGRSACAGYSKAFAYLLSGVGVRCACVSGFVDDNRKKGAHMWNIVDLGGKWCWCDVTWGDPVSELDADLDPEEVHYDYLCLGDSILFKTHRPDEYCSPFLPNWRAEGLDWYTVNGFSIGNYSDDAVVKAFVQQAERQAVERKSGYGTVAARLCGGAAEYIEHAFQNVCRRGLAKKPITDAYAVQGLECYDWAFFHNVEAGTVRCMFHVRPSRETPGPAEQASASDTRASRPTTSAEGPKAGDGDKIRPRKRDNANTGANAGRQRQPQHPRQEGFAGASVGTTSSPEKRKGRIPFKSSIFSPSAPQEVTLNDSQDAPFAAEEYRSVRETGSQEEVRVGTGSNAKGRGKREFKLDL